MGDGVLVEFGSAVNSVACAVELEKRMAQANDGVPDERHIILLRPPAMSAFVPLLEAQPTSGH